MRQQRKHKRIVKRLETEFSAGGSDFRGISSDLSEGGLFVRTSKPFAPDTLVDLTIHLPGNMVTRLKGRVRWAIKIGQMSAKNGMGIEIIESDQNFVNLLNTLLPPGEKMQDKENKNAGSAPAGAKIEPAAPPKIEHVVPPKSEQDLKDDEIDSMISALFSKRDKE
jgi:uncharacterized protein (TIGR02266 family)